MFLMTREVESDQEKAYDRFKQNVFASAFSAFDSKAALKQYYEVFEKEDEAIDYGYEEFEPEGEEDVQEMLNAARRLGVIK